VRSHSKRKLGRLRDLRLGLGFEGVFSKLLLCFEFWQFWCLFRCVAFAIDRLGDRISVAEKRRDESRRGQERQEHREVCWTLVCWSLAPCNRRWQG